MNCATSSKFSPYDMKDCHSRNAGGRDPGFVFVCDATAKRTACACWRWTTSLGCPTAAFAVTPAGALKDAYLPKASVGRARCQCPARAVQTTRTKSAGPNPLQSQKAWLRAGHHCRRARQGAARPPARSVCPRSVRRCSPTVGSALWQPARSIGLPPKATRTPGSGTAARPTAAPKGTMQASEPRAPSRGWVRAAGQPSGPDLDGGLSRDERTGPGPGVRRKVAFPPAQAAAGVPDLARRKFGVGPQGVPPR